MRGLVQENPGPNQSQIGGLDGRALSNGFTTIGPDLDISLLVSRKLPVPVKKDTTT